MARNQKFEQREDNYSKKLEAMKQNAEERLKWIEEYAQEINKKRKEEEEAEYTDGGDPGVSTEVPAATPDGNFQFQGGTGFNGENIAAMAQKIMNEHKNAPYSQAVRDIINKNTGDCSTLTRQAIQLAGGPNIGGYTGEQIANQAGQLIIPREQLLPGDCIFFKSTDGSGHRVNVPGVGSFNVVHCAIAMGGDKFIDMASGKGEWGGLGLRSLNTNWYGARYVCARRFAPPKASGAATTPAKPEEKKTAQFASLQFFADAKEVKVIPTAGQVSLMLPLPKIGERTIEISREYPRKEMYALYRRDFLNEKRLVRLPSSRYESGHVGCTLLVHPLMLKAMDLIHKEFRLKNLLKKNKLSILQSFTPKANTFYGIGLAVKIQTGYNKEETYRLADIISMLGFQNVKPGNGFIHVDLFEREYDSYPGYDVYVGPNSWR